MVLSSNKSFQSLAPLLSQSWEDIVFGSWRTMLKNEKSVFSVRKKIENLLPTAKMKAVFMKRILKMLKMKNCLWCKTFCVDIYFSLFFTFILLKQFHVSISLRVFQIPHGTYFKRKKSYLVLLKGKKSKN
jgi:hypothetical protein